MDAKVGSAPADILFIHGAGGNHLLWNRVLESLDGPGRAFAVDLPGHPSGEIACHTIREYSEALYRYAKDNKLGATSVCGHSMGSAISLTLALDHPEVVSSMILVGAGAKLGVDPSIVQGLKDSPLKTIEQLITPMSFLKVDLEVGREARKTLSISNLPVFLNDYMACNGFDVRDRLNEVRVPTLIVCGADDRMTPVKWSTYLKEKIAGSKMEVLPDCGHMVPIEKPIQCAALIRTFLEDLNR